MSIIVEGPDGSGKTTLIRDLLKRNRELNLIPLLNLIPSLGPVETIWAAEERKEWYIRLTPMKNIIFDRSYFFSEYIYGPIFRDKSLVFSQEIEKYIDLIISSNSEIIFCNKLFTHKEDPEKQNKFGNEELATQKQKLILESYRNLFNYFCLERYKYFYTLEDYNEH